MSPAAAQHLLLTELHAGWLEGLSSGRRSLQELKVLFSWAFTPSLLFTQLCSLTPSRQTQSTCGFTLDPLVGVCLGPWALAHGCELDSVPWQGQGITSPSCPCLLPEVALPVPRHPTALRPGSAHTGNTLACRVLHTPPPQAELGAPLHRLGSQTRRDLSPGRSPTTLNLY